MLTHEPLAVVYNEFISSTESCVCAVAEDEMNEKTQKNGIRALAFIVNEL